MTGHCNSDFLKDPDGMFDDTEQGREEEDADYYDDDGDDDTRDGNESRQPRRGGQINEEYEDDEDGGDDDVTDDDSGREDVRGAHDKTRRPRREEDDAEDVRGAWESVTIAYRLNGSLTRLSTDPTLSTVGLRQDVVGVFESPNSQSSSSGSSSSISSASDEKPEKRSDHHLLGGMWLTEYHSDFPCTLHMSVEGMSGHQKSFTSHGAEGVFTFFPKAQASNVRVPLYEATTSADNTFLKKFPGWNLGNIKDGMVQLPDGGLSVIKASHPVIAMYNLHRRQREEPPLQKADESPPGHYTVQTEEVTRCVESLRESMEKHLRMLNLYGLQMKFSRAYTNSPVASSNSAMSSTGSETMPWRDAHEVLDGLESEAGKRKMLGQPRNLYFKVLYKFKVV